MDWSHFLTKSVAVKQFNSLKLMFYSHKFNQSSHKAYSKVSDLLCFLSGFEFQEALNTDIPALLERVSQKREEMIQQGMPGAELWMHWIERWKTDAAEMGKKRLITVLSLGFQFLFQVCLFCFLNWLIRFWGLMCRPDFMS